MVPNNLDLLFTTASQPYAVDVSFPLGNSDLGKLESKSLYKNKNRGTNGKE